MPLRSDIVGVVLAGGSSSRMGTDKALLPLAGAPIITYAARSLSEVCSEVIVASGDQGRYSFLGLREIFDVFKDSGPLAGIHSALLEARDHPVFVIACDLPFVNRELVEFVIDSGNLTRTRVASAEGRIQPLFGLYDPKILTHLEHCLRTRELSVLKALAGYEHDVVVIEPSLPFYRPNILQNINTRSDYHTTSGRSLASDSL
jgi:molybdopterin-guanine dinucleotide biosynthesis protein A